MSGEKSVLVNVGDLIISRHDGQEYPAVVTALSLEPPFATVAADVLETTNGDNGLLLGPPGSHIDPIIVVLGSIPLEDVAKSLVGHGLLTLSSEAETLKRLEAAVLPEPVERPCE
jgi:hypothetical protein